ncbi:TetR/AcrR family transcriptional regulator [Caenibius sp. WL]|nr:TetR/AcrR family transcriptional regulator [Caenibius sp. WL]
MGGREKVLRAAIRILESSGIRGLSLRAAGDEAGVALPTVQHHFTSLAALLDEACEAILLRADQEASENVPFERAIKADEALALRKLAAAAAHRLGICYARTVGEFTAVAHLARHRRGRAASRAWAARRLREVRRFVGEHRDRRFLAELSVGMELLSLGCAQMPNIALLNQELLEGALAHKIATDEVPFWFAWENANLAPALAMEKSPKPNKPGRPSAMPRPLYAAAVALFAEGGLSAMTFRALAAKANTSVSVVSYHIPTSALIFYGAYRLIHSRSGWPGRKLAEEPEPLLAVALADIAGVRAHLLSFQALAAAATEPEFQFHAWCIRMMRGGHFWRNNAEDLNLRSEDSARHLFSVWLLGAGLLAEATLDPEKSRAFLRERTTKVRERLGLAAVPEHHRVA